VLTPVTNKQALLHPLQRNYRFFFIFVVSTTLLCVYVFAFSAVNIKLIMRDRHREGKSASVPKAMSVSPVSVLLMAYTFLAIFFTGGLSVLHSVFITKNQVMLAFRLDLPSSRFCSYVWSSLLSVRILVWSTWAYLSRSLLHWQAVVLHSVFIT
jgi:hypothetical protein